MIAIALKLLLGGWNRLLSALTSAWSWATKNPALALCALLAALTAWLWHGRNEARENAATQKAGWVAEVRLRKADHAAYRAAQVEAERLAREAISHTEARYVKIARESDNANAEIDRLRRAADRFAIVRARAVASAASGSVAPGEGSPAPDRDGPGSDAVLLTKPEYDELVSNTLRLEKVRQWGQSLIAEGLAIPEAEFGQ